MISTEDQVCGAVTWVSIGVLHQDILVGYIDVYGVISKNVGDIYKKSVTNWLKSPKSLILHQLLAWFDA